MFQTVKAVAIVSIMVALSGCASFYKEGVLDKEKNIQTSNVSALAGRATRIDEFGASIYSSGKVGQDISPRLAVAVERDNYFCKGKTLNLDIYKLYQQSKNGQLYSWKPFGAWFQFYVNEVNGDIESAMLTTSRDDNNPNWSRCEYYYLTKNGLAQYVKNWHLDKLYVSKDGMFHLTDGGQSDNEKALHLFVKYTNPNGNPVTLDFRNAKFTNAGKVYNVEFAHTHGSSQVYLWVGTRDDTFTDSSHGVVQLNPGQSFEGKITFYTVGLRDKVSDGASLDLV